MNKRGIRMADTMLTEIQLDALREVGNIGMGHAATALSQLVGKTVHLNVPRVMAMDAMSLPQACGGAERMVAGIYIQILGNARGNILIVFPRDNTLSILEKLLSSTPSATALTELEISTLKEVGNILASAYLNALGSMLKMTLIPSIPLFSFDMADTVVARVLGEHGETGSAAFMIETEFTIDSERTSGHIFLLPATASLDVILNAINA